MKRKYNKTKLFVIGTGAAMNIGLQLLMSAMIAWILLQGKISYEQIRTTSFISGIISALLAGLYVYKSTGSRSTIMVCLSALSTLAMNALIAITVWNGMTSQWWKCALACVIGSVISCLICAAGGHRRKRHKRAF